ncbi:MAG: glutamyl-tRNA reductase [Verrucomicrobia bacterium]|nr:glutamyl-tRNA reductase [Verrucomicrobiota bacterium]
MNIVCFGLSHQTAAVEVRERFALLPGELPAAVRRLRALPGVSEAVILSTCNRVEYFAVTAPAFPHCDPRRARDIFRAHCAELAAAGEPAELDCFYHLDAPASVAHLFRVASGLESMVIGETEILGQVKNAYRLASEEAATARVLNRLFQRAFRAAKEVRSQTSITRGAVSVGSVAVDLAEQIFGDLSARKVLILGAGDTGERVARSLLSRGAQSIFVSNRHHDRAVALASELGGQALGFDEWQHAAAGELDIIISSTAAPHHVITRTQMEPLLRERPDRPLFLIDLAVPRDVEPSVNELEGVYLYDIDSLQAIADQALHLRRQELERCEALIAAHVADFNAWMEHEARRLGIVRVEDNAWQPQPARSTSSL